MRDLEAGVSSAEVAERYGISLHTARNWSRKVSGRVPGRPALGPRVQAQIAGRAEGRSADEIAKELGIGPSAVRATWRRYRVQTDGEEK